MFFFAHVKYIGSSFLIQFISGSIHRGSIHRRVDSLQDQFVDYKSGFI
jgi:hypothetical protein